MCGAAEVTPARSLLIAATAVVLLISGHPIAGDEQFPRGLLSAPDPRAPERFCTIETRPLSFPAYDPLDGREVTAIGQVIYGCGRVTRGCANPPCGGGGGGNGNKSIRIEMAQGPGNSFAPRRMVGLGGSHLEYNIYLDATRRMVWGTGEGPTQVYIDSNPPNRTPVIVPAFGRIFGRQEVEAGPYTDDVPVRILF
jgi:spore coat protein U-like protein